jgi:hypothetical protein
VIVGAGTIYRIRCAEGATAVRVTCLPTRGMPATLVAGSENKERVLETGARIWA